MTKIENDLE